MTDNVRLTVKELADGLPNDPYYCDDKTVGGRISEILLNVHQNNWPTKHFGQQFRLVLTWIAWGNPVLTTYLPGSDIPITQSLWETAFKGYKTTWPTLVFKGQKYEYMDTEIKKVELEKFLNDFNFPLPCPHGGLPAKWFYKHPRNSIEEVRKKVEELENFINLTAFTQHDPGRRITINC